MNQSLLALIAAVMATPAFAQSSTVTSTAATTSAPISEVKSDLASKLSYSAAIESSIVARDANRGDFNGSLSSGDERTGLESFQHIAAAYDLGNSKKVQLRQYFVYKGVNKTFKEEGDYRGGDTVIRYSNGEAFKLGDAVIGSQYRLYMPLLSDARDTSSTETDNPLWTARVYHTTTQEFGKASVEYTLQQRFFTRDVTNAASEMYRAYAMANLSYQLSSVVKPFIQPYTVHQFYKSGADKNNINSFATDIGAEIAFNKNVSLLAYVITTDDLGTGKNNWDITDENQNEYEIDISISL